MKQEWTILRQVKQILKQKSELATSNLLLRTQTGSKTTWSTGMALHPVADARSGTGIAHKPRKVVIKDHRTNQERTKGTRHVKKKTTRNT